MDQEPTSLAPTNPTQVTEANGGVTKAITATKARTLTKDLDKSDTQEENETKTPLTDEHVQDQVNDDAESSRPSKDYDVGSAPDRHKDDNIHDTTASADSFQTKILQRLSVNLESLGDLFKLARAPFDRGDGFDYLRSAVGFGDDGLAVVRYQLSLIARDLELLPKWRKSEVKIRRR